MEKTDLQELRGKIDGIDDQIAELLVKRTDIVQQVGALKERTHPGLCPIRPGREAGMIRRIVKKFTGGHFSPAAAAAMWRGIITASLAVESKMTVSAFAAERDDSLYWLAREYFGSFTAIHKQGHIKRVIGDVIDGKASVGVVPFLRGSDTSYWWTNLMQPGKDAPKIFAHIPFVIHGAPSHDAPAGLAVGRVVPEATGDDTSFIVLEADHNVSQHRLQTAFTEAALDASWVNIATLTPDRRHHLLQIKGFIDDAHPAMNKLLSSLGASILHVAYLGAYANPISLSESSHVHTAHGQ